VSPPNSYFLFGTLRAIRSLPVSPGKQGKIMRRSLLLRKEVLGKFFLIPLHSHGVAKKDYQSIAAWSYRNILTIREMRHNPPEFPGGVVQLVIVGG